MREIKHHNLLDLVAGYRSGVLVGGQGSERGRLSIRERSETFHSRPHQLVNEEASSQHPAPPRL